MLAKTLEAAAFRRHESEGTVTNLHDFWGPRTGNPDGFQVLLVDHAEPNGSIKPHFHVVDQFQIFTGGTGRVGRLEVAPGTIHYTDEYTAYGPIVNQESAIRYLVVRPKSDPGAKYMPGSRELMIKPAGRTRHFQVDMSQPCQTSSARELSNETDGLVVCELRVAPGAQLPDPPSGVGKAGGCYVVLDGKVIVQAEEYPKESCICVGTGERLVASGGVEGAIVAFLQFSDRHQD